ncbi:MAG TPA: hypothetical protein VK171_06970 [Fimbriimonas sp.]|nr:hypothetical protein [Fimbriimonas sp.]
MQPNLPNPEMSNYPRIGEAESIQNLRDIAKYQRQVVLCVLGQIGVAVLNGASRVSDDFILAGVVVLLGIFILVCTIGAVWRLSKALSYSSLINAVLMFIPCVSLIVLLVLNSKASARLKAAGYKVGFFGADPKQIN